MKSALMWWVFMVTGVVVVVVITTWIMGLYYPSFQSVFLRASLKDDLAQPMKPAEHLHQNYALSPAEKASVVLCTTTSASSRKAAHQLFWSGNTQYIRHTNHSYLTADSLVLDVGGNVGTDAKVFIERYNVKMYIFEPLPTYVARLNGLFKANPKVKVIGLGLGKKDQDLRIEIKGHDGDASSIYTGKNVTTGELVKIRRTSDVMRDLGLLNQPIDLFHINCEGCEYDVLESIVYSDMIGNLKHIQFATHNMYPGVEEPDVRYCIVQEILKRTHKIMYQYKFTWESWELK